MCPGHRLMVGQHPALCPTIGPCWVTGAAITHPAFTNLCRDGHSVADHGTPPGSGLSLVKENDCTDVFACFHQGSYLDL